MTLTNSNPLKQDTDINTLCGSCNNPCRQRVTVTLIQCPKYVPSPVQMAFKFKVPKIREKKEKAK